MTRHTVPAEDAWVGPDKSVLILIKHCRDMKQQETCLRFITLLLLLSCMGLFLFTAAADLRKYENSGSSGQESTVQQRQAYSKQDRQCIGEDTSTSSQRPYINLRAKYTNKSDGQYMKWDKEFGEKYNKQRGAIEILENGVYFVYVEIALSCNSNGPANFKKFYTQVHKWNEGYNKTIILTKHRDGIACTPLGFRTVFVGRIFEMFNGDHVSVWIAEGFNLIETATFGAYFISTL